MRQHPCFTRDPRLSASICGYELRLQLVPIESRCPVVFKLLYLAVFMEADKRPRCARQRAIGAVGVIFWTAQPECRRLGGIELKKRVQIEFQEGRGRIRLKGFSDLDNSNARKGPVLSV